MGALVAGNTVSSRTYVIPGMDHDLSSRVCTALYLKRQGLSTVEIDLDKMVAYFNSDKETLVKIITWYQSNLIDTVFDYGQT